MKKKKWFILPGIMAVIFAVSGMAYHHLSASYAPKEAESVSAEAKVMTASEKQADDFVVYDENGNKVSLSNYTGKPLVVNFWASWCPPCKREMPAFQKVADVYGEEAVFLMINETDGERETVETARTFLEDNGYHMNVFFDTEGNAESTYQIFFLPRTLFIRADGTIAEDHVGEMSEIELTDIIEKLLLSA